MYSWTAFKSIISTVLRLPRHLFSRNFSDFSPVEAPPPVSTFWIVALKLLLLSYPALFLAGLERPFRYMRRFIYGRMHNELKKNCVPVTEFTPVQEVRKEELATHLRNFFDHPRPFVVRHYHKESAAVKTWSPKWFSENYGDFLCSSAELSDHTPTKLSTLIEQGHYINFLDRIFRAYPELESQLDTREITQTLADSLGLEHTYNELFIATRKNTATKLHNHSVWNFFLQVSDNKEWIFIDPEYSHLVYSQTHTLEFASEIEPNDPLSKWPLYSYCPKYKVTLRPGDLLFNPPMWWHQVSNETKENGNELNSIGVTLKYYDSIQNSPTTFSNPRFNRFNEVVNAWRLLFVTAYARSLSRGRIKYSQDPEVEECPIQARIWGPPANPTKKPSRWQAFRRLCLSDPEADKL